MPGKCSGLVSAALLPCALHDAAHQPHAAICAESCSWHWIATSCHAMSALSSGQTHCAQNHQQLGASLPTLHPSCCPVSCRTMAACRERLPLRQSVLQWPASDQTRRELHHSASRRHAMKQTAKWICKRAAAIDGMN